MLWIQRYGGFSQILYFGCLSSSTVNWMEIQGAMEINVRKRLVGGTFPFFGKSVCQFMGTKAGIIFVHL